MLNDLAFFTCIPQQNASIKDAKDVFGENTPYVILSRLSGNIIIFSDHFIDNVRKAFTTGCMSSMNFEEELLLNKYIKYQNNSMFRDITNDESAVLVALDEWLIRLINCEPQPTLTECDYSLTYKTCVN